MGRKESDRTERLTFSHFGRLWIEVRVGVWEMKDRVKTFPGSLENEWNLKEKNRENKQREYKGLV